ncbi:MAG: HNH endonuclease [Isosphaeraceae bacterium]
MRAELRALASKSPHPAIPARPRKRGSPRSPREKERRPRRACNSTVNRSRATHGVDATLERLVRDRADGRCEYCRLPQAGSRAPFEIDHIIARIHRGRTVAGNLALSCVYWK